MSILFAILLFSVLIFVHELGHFVAAKLSGVQVNEFAMFMGPAIFKKKIGNTVYSLRCIPIGGYCAMEGEDEDTDSPNSFQKAKWWKRLIILVAGAFMNFIVGLLIIAIVLSSSESYINTTLTEVDSWSSASCEGGLLSGDTIVEFNGKRIDIYQDFMLETALLKNGNYDITVIRDGEEVELNDVPMNRQEVKNEDGTTSMLYGISFGISDTTAKSVTKQILPTAMSYVDSVFMSIKMLFTGQAGLSDMSGPVGIVDMMAETADAAPSFGKALVWMLEFGGLIAINLAVMNLLPLPALDGGRVFCLLVTTVIEKITKKKLNPKYEAYIHAAGMILLLLLMAVIMAKDIVFLFKR